MAYSVIITGATGMVGEAVLHECILDNRISKILVINRRPCGVNHPKLMEIIHHDFFDFSPIEDKLAGYDGCFFCLGISSVGKSEENYFKFTYTLTMHVANILVRHNPQMVFCYISGAGTDSSERGTLMWARVKGKTENELAKLPFKKVYAFRPGFMKPTNGLKNAHGFYKYVNWMYPALRKWFPNYVTTVGELGRAMINVLDTGYEKDVLEVKDIVKMGIG